MTTNFQILGKLSMAINDVHEVALHYNGSENAYLTTFAFKETADITGPVDNGGISQAFTGQILVSLADMLSEETFFGGVVTRTIVSAGTPRITDWSYYSDSHGTIVAGDMAGLACANTVIRGTNHGRNIRGMLKISGTPLNGFDNNGWDSTIETAWNAFSTALLGGLTLGAPWTGTLEFGFMSRAPVTPGDPLVAWPGVFLTPTSLSLSPTPGVIRSRFRQPISVD